MMNVSYTKAKARISYSVGVEGSVLAQTVQARADRIEIHYDIQSTDEPGKVAGLIRNARNGCYVRQTVGRPEIFHDTVNLNGTPLKFEDYPPPTHR